MVGKFLTLVSSRTVRVYHVITLPQPTDHIMPHHLQSNREESHRPHQIVSSKGIIYSREPFHFAKLNLELAEY